ncbi:hypothetical protein Kim5_CH02917 [Rhizobium sp. Kim5]|uniref:hypothetical protein n=1 Tax=Rhizobium sp. Kim5 TaxID=2020311 RepID=UPI000A2A3453|nr:hypothetical protein [Rhizobium sp. Kim5]ARQ58960.1 hypothetical protein Kim5_CH02917 [Rhizobium sp. Kim5]
MRRSATVGVIGSIFSVLMAGSALSGEEEDALIGVGEFGVSFVTSVATIYKAGTAPSVVPANADDATKELGRLVDKYKQNMQTTAATADITKSSGELVIKTAVIAGTASGVGAVPSAIVGSLAYWGNSAFADHIRKDGEQQARNVLKSGIENWDKKSKVSFDDVQKMFNEGKHKEAAEALEKATGALGFIKGELKDDPVAADAAEQVLFKVLSENSRATIEELGETKGNLAELSKNFTNHVEAAKKIGEETNKKLDEVTGRLGAMESNLQQGLDSLNRISKSNETQINLIGDVLFGQQSTEVKILMLEKGAKPELTGQARDDLIKVLQVQKSKEDFIQDTGEIVSNLQGINSIMTSLGIGNADISKAINYASVAQTAISQALTGNYIGALAGALGVFGGNQPSAEEQRFKQIMGFLEQMDKKLNVIIDLQQKTLAAIQDLSKQLSDVERRLNERLDVIEFVAKTTSENLKTKMWEDIGYCPVAYQQRGNGYVQSNESFKSVRDLYAFMKVEASDAIKCARNLELLFTTIKDKKIFGKPLSLSTAAYTDFSLAPGESPDRVNQRDDLQRFLTEVYNPTFNTVFVNGWKSEKWGHPANAVAFLGTPAATTTGVRRRLADIENGAKLSACSSDSNLSWRLRSLLCATTLYAPESAPDKIVEDDERLALERLQALMQDPIVRDQLPRLIQWSAFSARPYDLWNGNADGYYDDLKMLAEKGTPRGKSLIWSTLEVVDLGIAQQSMLYGDLTAKFVYDAIWDKAKNQPSIDLNIDQAKLFINPNNPWLAQNVLMFAMEDSLKPELANADITIPYERALEPFFDTKLPFVDQKRIGHTFLKSLFNFPDTVDYTLGPDQYGSDKQVVYIIYPCPAPKPDVPVGCKVKLPDPKDFQAKLLVYPRSLYDLLRQREMLSERFVDYEVMKDIDKTDDGKLAMSVLLHGTNQR